MQILYRRGVLLPELPLWLDAQSAQPRAVVSHAHSDHARAHEEVLTSTATAALMRLRGLTRPRFHVAPYGEPLATGSTGWSVTLYPAGHILGSAQVLVERDGERLLYSGDFRICPARTAEPIEIPRADTVVMETTFGRRVFRFPPPSRVLEEIAAFCRQALEDGCTPVLFCYSLGKGQELLAGLGSSALPCYLHAHHHQAASLYRDLGVPLPAYRVYTPGASLDGPLLCAPGARNAAWFRSVRSPRTAFISGWAADGAPPSRWGADAAFPLSDHADYDELHEYVRRTGASRVYTLHGFAEEFASELRQQGLWAEALREPGPQMALF